MRLYTNENFPLPVAVRLRDLGHDVLTIQETGQAGSAQSDEDVLSFAARGSRILVTLNRRHFVALHLEKKTHAGILVCSFDPDFARFGRRVHERIQQGESWTGRLERLNREQPQSAKIRGHPQLKRIEKLRF
ncbi:MAG: DUF5615 family PIN-like protein [Nitrosomonadales bacterium]